MPSVVCSVSLGVNDARRAGPDRGLLEGCRGSCQFKFGTWENEDEFRIMKGSKSHGSGTDVGGIFYILKLVMCKARRPDRRLIFPPSLKWPKP